MSSRFLRAEAAARGVCRPPERLWPRVVASARRRRDSLPPSHETPTSGTFLTPRPPAVKAPAMSPLPARSVSVVRASTSREGAAYTGVRELPIFPLSVVALPAATVYLNIFEARYRVLFNTLLAGSDDLEEGLVDTESPYCGTREFGLCFVHQNGGLAAIGTLLHIEEHLRMEDGRMQVRSRLRATRPHEGFLAPFSDPSFSLSQHLEREE